MPRLPGTPPSAAGMRVTGPAAFGARGTPPPPPPPPLPTEGPTVRLPTVRTPAAPSAPAIRAPVTATPSLPTAPRAIPTAVSATRVFSVAKTHNVALADADLALQMDVDYEVRRQNGRDVYVAIWFVRNDTGEHIRAAVATYADTAGFLTLQTRSARVRGDAGRFTAALKIPYRAFPVAQPNDSYEVSARVQILRADGGGRVSSLAKGSTTFRVYGYPDDTPSAP
jgi:hypothetical protein